jgi:hypothetical protein
MTHESYRYYVYVLLVYLYQVPGTQYEHVRYQVRGHGLQD